MFKNSNSRTVPVNEGISLIQNRLLLDILMFGMIFEIQAQVPRCQNHNIIGAYYSISVPVEGANPTFYVPVVLQVDATEDRLFGEPDISERDNLWNLGTRQERYETVLFDIACLANYSPEQIRALFTQYLNEAPEAIKQSKLYDLLVDYFAQGGLDLDNTMGSVEAVYSPVVSVNSVISVINEIINLPQPPADLGSTPETIVDFFQGTDFHVYAGTNGTWNSIRNWLDPLSGATKAISQVASVAGLSAQAYEVIKSVFLGQMMANDLALKRLSDIKSALKQDYNSHIWNDQALQDALSNVESFLVSSNSEQAANLFMTEIIDNAGDITSGVFSVAQAFGGNHILSGLQQLATYLNHPLNNAALGGWAIGLLALQMEFKIILEISHQIENIELAVCSATIAGALCRNTTDNCKSSVSSIYGYFISSDYVVESFDLPWYYFSYGEETVEAYNTVRTNIETYLDEEYSNRCLLELPSITLVHPNSGEVIGGNNYQITADASVSVAPIELVEFQYTLTGYVNDWHPLPSPDSNDGIDYNGADGWQLRFDTRASGFPDFDASVWVRVRAIDSLGNASNWDESDLTFTIDNMDTGSGTGNLTLVATPNPVDAFATTTLVATYTDDNGNPLPGNLIEFRPYITGELIEPGMNGDNIVETDQNGDALIYFNPESESGYIKASVIGTNEEYMLLLAVNVPTDFVVTITAEISQMHESYTVYDLDIYGEDSNGNPLVGEPVLDVTTTLGQVTQFSSDFSSTGWVDADITTYESGLSTIGVVLTGGTNYITVYFQVGLPPGLEANYSVTPVNVVEINDIEWSSYGDKLLVAINETSEGRVDVWDMTDLSIISQLEHPDGEGEAFSAVFSPDETQVLVGFNGAFAKFYTSSGSMIRSTRNPDSGGPISFWRNNGIVVRGNEDSSNKSQALLLNSSLGVSKFITNDPTKIESMEWNRNNNVIAICDDYVDQVRFYSGSSFNLIKTWTTNESDNRVGWSPNGDKVVVTYDNDYFKVINYGTNQDIYSVGDMDDEAASIDWSTQGDYIAILEEAGRLHIHNGINGQILYSLYPSDSGGDFGRVLQWSPDGTILAVATYAKVFFYSLYDQIDPSISIQFPPNGYETYADSVVIVGQGGDGNGILQMLIGTSNDSTAINHDQGSFSSQRQLVPGVNTIRVIARDNYLNRSQFTFDVIMLTDTDGPVISNLSVSPTNLEKGDSCRIEVNIIDGISEIDGSSTLCIVHDRDSSIVFSKLLNDQGTAGDEVAGDHTYSAWLIEDDLGFSEYDVWYHVDIQTADDVASPNVSYYNNMGQMLIYDRPMILGYTAYPDSITSEDSIHFELDADDYSNIESAFLYYKIPSAQSYSSQTMVIDAETGDISVQLTPSPTGDFSFYFVAYDDLGISVQSDTNHLNIYQYNYSPVLSLPDSLVMDEDQSQIWWLELYVTDQNDLSSNIRWIFSISDPVIILDYDSVASSLTISATPDSFGENFQIFAIVEDPGGRSDTGVVDISILPVNDPPRFALSFPDTLSFNEDDTLSLALQVLYESIDDIDDPESTPTISIGDYHQGYWSVEPDTLRIWSLLNWYGDTTIWIRAADPHNAIDSTLIHLQIQSINDPPAISSSSTMEATEDVFFKYVATADDPDGPILSWTFDQLPSWLTANADSVFGTPLEGAVDTSFRVIASDGSINDTLIVGVIVSQVNDPPLITSSATAEATEDEYFKYLATAIDVDGPILSWTFDQLPSWLTANADSVFGTPLEGAVGTSFRVIASDGSLNDTLSVSVTVIAVNDPPILSSLSDTSLFEDDTLQVIFSAIDIDADILGFIVETDTSALGVSIGDSIITLIPDENWNGTAHITLVVSDGYASDSLMFTVTVIGVNDPPTIANPLSDIEVNEDADDKVINLDSLFTDVDIETNADSLVLSVLNSNEGLLNASIVGSQMTLSNNADQHGAAEILVTATDYGAATATDTFTVFVHPINDEPSLSQSLPNVSVDEDDFGTVIIPRLEDYFTDVDSIDNLSFNGLALDTGLDSLRIGNGSGMALTQLLGLDDILPTFRSQKRSQMKIVLNKSHSNGKLQDEINNEVGTTTNRNNTYPSFSPQALADTTALIVYPTVNFNGDIRIVVSAFDDSSASVSDTLLLTVTAINDAPVLSAIPDTSIMEDDTLRCMLSAFDLDEDSLSFAVECDTNAVTGILTDTVLTLVPDLNWNGSSWVTVSLSDNDTTVFNQFELTVLPVNDAPSSFTLDEQDSVYITMDNFDSDSIVFIWDESEDVDEDELTYHFTGEHVIDSQVITTYDTTLSKNELRIDYKSIFDEIYATQTMMVGIEWDVSVTDGTIEVLSENGPITVGINASDAILLLSEELLPVVFALHQNYPNPFNPTTTIQYELPKRSDVKITIFNLMGREVTALISETQDAGYKSITWNATNIPSGMYLYQIRALQKDGQQAGDFVQTKKMLLLK